MLAKRREEMQFNNYVRLQMYVEKLKQFSRKGSENEIILKIKKLHCSSRPPCSSVSRLCRSSYMQFQLCQYRFRLENNKCQTERLEGQACPCVMDILDVEEAELGKSSTNL